MADIERDLIAKLVQTGSWETALSSGIVADHFDDRDLKRVFEKCTDHFRKYRKAPSSKLVREEIAKGQHFDIITDSVEYVIDVFVKGVKRRRAIDALRNLSAVVDDPSKIGSIDELFLEQSRLLAQLIPQSQVALFSQMESRIQQYKDRVASGLGPMGIPTGVPTIDNLTLGIQQHEYVSVVGWSGTGKSTFTQYVLFNAYMAGKRPMMISLEMDADSLMRRWDAMATQVQYSSIKAQSMSQSDIDRWEKAAARASKATNDIIVLDDVGRCTVDRVHAEAVRWRPEIIAVDYVSLMLPSRASGAMWENVTQITQGLKQVARTLKIPIIGVAQTNRDSAEEGATLANISYSRSIGQDSDLVFGLHTTKDMRAEKKMQLRMIKNRDGRTQDVDLFWDLDVMKIEEWGPQHMFPSKPKEEAAK